MSDPRRQMLEEGHVHFALRPKARYRSTQIANTWIRASAAVADAGTVLGILADDLAAEVLAGPAALALSHPSFDAITDSLSSADPTEHRPSPAKTQPPVARSAKSKARSQKPLPSAPRPISKPATVTIEESAPVSATARGLTFFFFALGLLLGVIVTTAVLRTF